MEEFEISIPLNSELSNINPLDLNYYSYDFKSSLSPLQEESERLLVEQVRKNLFSSLNEVEFLERIFDDKEVEYIASLDSYKAKIKSGVVQLTIKKSNGDILPILKDTQTGKIIAQVPLKEREISNLGNLPEVLALQGQLAEISEQIETLNRLVVRVEQGQYNDRYAGVFSARQSIVESLVVEDEEIKKKLLVSSVIELNNTKSQLMMSIYSDATDYTNPKIKKREAKKIEQHLKESMKFLNDAIQLSLIAYTSLGEKKAILSTLMDYKSFIEQILLTPSPTSRTLAWQLDNFSDNGLFEETSHNLIRTLNVVLDKQKEITVEDKEKIEDGRT